LIAVKVCYPARNELAAVVVLPSFAPYLRIKTYFAKDVFVVTSEGYKRKHNTIITEGVCVSDASAICTVEEIASRNRTSTIDMMFATLLYNILFF
jgi:hypothetical protein